MVIDGKLFYISASLSLEAKHTHATPKDTCDGLK